MALTHASSAVGSDGPFLNAASARKNVFLAHSTSFTAATSLRLTEHGSPPNLESACFTKLRVPAAKCEGRR